MATIHSRRVARTFDKGRPITESLRDVLERMSQGQSPQEIAYDRGTSLRTVEHQLRIIRGRLGAKNTVHAMAIWIQGKE